MAESPRDRDLPRQIDNREDLEAWLRAQKPGVAVAIAARTALRVAPLAERAFPQSRDAQALAFFLNLTGAIFRATALAWVAAVYPTRANELRASAYAAAADASAYAAAADASAYAAAADASAYAAAADASAYAAAAAADASAYAAADADAAAAAAYAAAAYAAATADIWSAVSFDVAFIENGASPITLASQRLWPNGAPSWAEDAWKKLRSDLPAKDNWWVWTNWYHTVLSGETLSEEHSLIYVTVPESEWKKGPAAANAWIAARLKETGEMAPEESDLPPSSESQPISIPAPKPATIEPIIRAGKIALPDGAAEPELDAEAFNQALRALRSLIINLANDLDGEAEANIDKRAIGFLRRIGDGIPHDAPTQEQLFELAHQQETLEDYGKKVAAEWPDLLASRYLGVVRAFDGTMRQFAKWRSFKQNALKDRLTEEQRDYAPALAKKFADALRDSANAEHVESAIPSVIENMAREIDREAEDAPPRERGAAGADTRAEDLITSIDNTIKRIGDVAVKGDVEKRAQAGFGAKVAKGFASQFDGEKLGENLGKWATSALLAAGASYGATHPTELGNILAELMQQYPIIAQWLQPLIDHLRR